ncbi:hypothetical protein Xcc1_20800 [Xanthomonas campestris pv. campestris]|nr:hypothetical protein Xcc1_20800 [Xanthomonas campestris pv. campestris]
MASTRSATHVGEIMSTTGGWVFYRIFAALAAVCLTGPAWADDSSAIDHEWQFATLVLKDSYCMGEVCLGMTLAEVEQIHGTSVQDWESNKWERNCLGSFANSETVGFTGKDGTEFILGLLDFPGGEDYKQRFRVRSVSLYVQATRTEYDAMVDQLVQRWNMGLKGDSPSPAFVVHHHPTEYFSTELFTKFAYLPQRSMITLSAKMDRYPDWVRG